MQSVTGEVVGSAAISACSSDSAPGDFAALGRWTIWDDILGVGVEEGAGLRHSRLGDDRSGWRANAKSTREMG